jgi:hypothetical protein
LDCLGKDDVPISVKTIQANAESSLPLSFMD